jgi:hypothetical protein
MASLLPMLKLKKSFSFAAGTTVASVMGSSAVILSLAATATATNTLSYYAVNSFFGGTIVNGGTLQLVNNSYAGGNGPISFNGGTFISTT